MEDLNGNGNGNVFRCDRVACPAGTGQRAGVPPRRRRRGVPAVPRRRRKVAVHRTEGRGRRRRRGRGRSRTGRTPRGRSREGRGKNANVSIEERHNRSQQQHYFYFLMQTKANMRRRTASALLFFGRAVPGSRRLRRYPCAFPGGNGRGGAAHELAHRRCSRWRCRPGPHAPDRRAGSGAARRRPVRRPMAAEETSGLASGNTHPFRRKEEECFASSDAMKRGRRRLKNFP